MSHRMLSPFDIAVAEEFKMMVAMLTTVKLQM